MSLRCDLENKFAFECYFLPLVQHANLLALHLIFVFQETQVAELKVKQEMELKKAEENERMAFLALSDREKVCTLRSAVTFVS